MHAQNCHLYCVNISLQHTRIAFVLKEQKIPTGKNQLHREKKKLKPHAFSRELIFHLAGRYHFSFSARRYKIFALFFQLLNKIRLLGLLVCFFNLSRQLFLCYPLPCRHKHFVEKKNRLCCCFFSLRSPGGSASSKLRHFTSAYTQGVDRRAVT